MKDSISLRFLYKTVIGRAILKLLINSKTLHIKIIMPIIILNIPFYYFSTSLFNVFSFMDLVALSIISS